MEQQSTERIIESRPAPSAVVWEHLEAFARRGVQELLQRVLEEEVEGVLRRARYERRHGVDTAAGYRNGFGKPRRVSLSVGTVTVRRPRVRGLAERFESRILPLFKQRTEAVGQLLPTLYLHGLALGDFDLALRGLLGDGAPLSAASVARLKASWQAEYVGWRSRSLAELEPVFVWVDGVYVKAGLEKDKAAMLVVPAGLRDGRKVILAVESGHRESTESWGALLRDLKRRGLRAPRLVIGDGHLGLWGFCSVRSRSRGSSTRPTPLTFPGPLTAPVRFSSLGFNHRSAPSSGCFHICRVAPHAPRQHRGGRPPGQPGTCQAE